MRKIDFRALLREPLLHFLLIGLALFLLYGRVSPGEDDSRRIVVSQQHVDDMIGQYRLAFNRPPTRAELNSLIDSYVRDEIAYREGVSMGLDKDDAVIKRRIRQKHELIAEEEQRSEPTERDLTAYLMAHPAKFLRPPIVSFEQVFFDPGTTSPESVQAVKAFLARGADPAKHGQPSMLPRQVSNAAISLVASDFGDNFAKQVAAAPIGQWVGPLASGFGVHLLRVKARTSPAAPPLAEIRAAVAREWESDRRARSKDASYRKARDEYDVIIKAALP